MIWRSSDECHGPSGEMGGDWANRRLTAVKNTIMLADRTSCLMSGVAGMQFPPPCFKCASTERTHRLLPESNLNDPHRSAPHVALAHAADPARASADEL